VKTIVQDHAPVISGSFTFTIGGVSLNNGSLSYDVTHTSLQAHLRTIIGYENVEVERYSMHGPEYKAHWVISYKGVHSAIPAIVIGGALL
jgi:hypothetical protein